MTLTLPLRQQGCRWRQRKTRCHSCFNPSPSPSSSSSSNSNPSPCRSHRQMAGRVYTSRRLANVCQVRNGGDLLLRLLLLLQLLTANICDCFVFDFHSGAVSLAARKRMMVCGTSGRVTICLCSLGCGKGAAFYEWLFLFVVACRVVLVLLRLLLLVEQTNW